MSVVIPRLNDGNWYQGIGDTDESRSGVAYLHVTCERSNLKLSSKSTILGQAHIDATISPTNRTPKLFTATVLANICGEGNCTDVLCKTKGGDIWVLESVATIRSEWWRPLRQGSETKKCNSRPSNFVATELYKTWAYLNLLHHDQDLPIRFIRIHYKPHQVGSFGQWCKFTENLCSGEIGERWWKISINPSGDPEKQLASRSVSKPTPSF